MIKKEEETGDLVYESILLDMVQLGLLHAVWDDEAQETRYYHPAFAPRGGKAAS